MGKKIVKIDGKTFVVDSETKEMSEVENEDSQNETSMETENTQDDEKKDEETSSEETSEIDNEAKLQEATDKVVASLGLDKLQSSIKSIEEKLGKKEEGSNKKISALLDLETLMNKDVDKMTAKEKIVGFYQAMIQNNHTVLKALSEGTAADGGLRKIIAHFKLDELLENPLRVISSQAFI